MFFHPALEPPRTGKKSDSSVFDLVGVVNHSGSIGGGHYTAFNFNSFVRRWYRYNDATVTMVEPQESVTDTLAAQVVAEKEKASASVDEKSGEEDQIGSAASSSAAVTGAEKAADAGDSETSASASTAPTSAGDVAKGGAKAMDIEDSASNLPPDGEATDKEAAAEDPPEKEKEYKGKPLSSYKPEELDAALYDQIVTPEAYLLFYVQREETSPYNGHRFEIPDSVRKEFAVEEEKTSETKTTAASDSSTPVVPVDTKTPEAAAASGPTASSGPMDLPTSVYSQQPDGSHKRSKSDPVSTARIHPVSMAPPSDEAIAQFISITNCERDVAITFLQKSGNDPNRAIQIFYS